MVKKFVEEQTHEGCGWRLWLEAVVGGGGGGGA